jgi:acetyl esterase/lipase
MRLLFGLLALLAWGFCSMTEAISAPLTWSELLKRPRETADLRSLYGTDPQQFGELWLPSARPTGDLSPVIIMIHGGCWRADLTGLELTDYLAAALKRSGFAVWNIEYRRLGHIGGGWPGTFADVAAAIDHLRVLAGPHSLDLNRVLLSGHSAGGHLALWGAARHRLPPGHALRGANPLPVRGVVTLAGINDLAAYHATGPDACGGPTIIEQLIGQGQRSERDLYAESSPPRLRPLGIPQILISGMLDHIVPSRFGATDAAAGAATGDRVSHHDLPSAGHFELIDPTAPAWDTVLASYRELLREGVINPDYRRP